MTNLEQLTTLSLPGDPSQWPNITDVQINGERAELSIYIPQELVWFSGHFPGLPVLPGVVQIFWVECLTRQLFGRFPSQYQLRNLKFKEMVAPDTSLTLTLTASIPAGRMAFAYQREGKSVSSGTFVEVTA